MKGIMTDQEINKAIARKCGWKPRHHCPGYYRDDCDGYIYTLPNYCTDLNAMHEAEGSLDDDPTNPAQEWGRYRDALIAFCKKHEVDPIFAHARQRAEAFVRTFGLWSE